MLAYNSTNTRVKWFPKKLRFLANRRIVLFTLFLVTGTITMVLYNHVNLLHPKTSSEKSENESENFISDLLINDKMNNDSKKLKLWPEEFSGDRIINQLTFSLETKPNKIKTILLYNGLLYNDLRTGSKAFSECPVKSCYVSTNRRDVQDADAILFRNQMEHPNIKRSNDQVWILYSMESPCNTQTKAYGDLINWTATYRSDSDLVIPYGKWVYYDDKITELPNPLKNFAANKTKKVAWFVSNCRAVNNRLEYAHELQKYIQVDIYGSCGNFSCPRDTERSCLKLLSEHYKFYLAFENSNCQDYITEKLFVNSLQHDVLPIVMGARPEEYRRWTPKNSHIHVEEFESPRKLAEYLHKLDQNDDLYNSYFKWRGTGEVLTNTHLYCRLCALLHSDPPHKWYPDFLHWWCKPDTCTVDYWRDNIPTDTLTSYTGGTNPTPAQSATREKIPT